MESCDVGCFFLTAFSSIKNNLHWIYFSNKQYTSPLRSGPSLRIVPCMWPQTWEHVSNGGCCGDDTRAGSDQFAALGKILAGNENFFLQPCIFIPVNFDLQTLVPVNILPLSQVVSHSLSSPSPPSQIKPWSELSCLLRLYFCFTVASLLALLGLTLYSVYQQHTEVDPTAEDNFTVSLIQMVGICEYGGVPRTVSPGSIAICTVGKKHKSF